jgi:hypothetical protein
MADNIGLEGESQLIILKILLWNFGISVTSISFFGILLGTEVREIYCDIGSLSWMLH